MSDPTSQLSSARKVNVERMPHSNYFFILAALAVFLYLSAPWLYVPGFDNDDSWQVIMNNIAISEESFVFGKDIVFTYGPSSYLFSRAYHPLLLETKILFWFYLGSFAAYTIVRYSLALRLKAPYTALLVMCVIYAFPDQNLRLIFPEALLMGLLLLSAQLVCLRPNLLNTVAFWSFTALLFFAKGTLMVVTLLVSIIVIGCKFSQRKTLVLSVTTAAVSIFAISLMLDSNLQDIPGYVTSTLAVGQGYFNGLFLPADHNPLILIAIGLVLTSCFYFGERNLITFGTWVSCLAILFVSWQHFIVRGNTTLLLCLPLLLFCSLGRFEDASEVRKRTVVLMIFLTLMFAESSHYQKHSEPLILSKIKGLQSRLTDFSSEALVESYQSKVNEVSVLKKSVGDHSLDIFDEEQAIPTYADIKHSFRPTLLAFGTYNDFMMEANYRSVLESKLPDYVLNLYVARSEIYPLSYDTLWTKTLLTKYSFDSTTEYYSRPLFRLDKQLQWRTTEKKMESTVFGEWSELPADCDIVVMSDFTLSDINLGQKLLKITKTYLVGPPTLYIETVSSSGKETESRANPTILSSQYGMIISPRISNWSDFVEFSSNSYDRVEKFRLTTSFPEYFPGALSYKTQCTKRVDS
jgi:hypothetical protein